MNIADNVTSSKISNNMTMLVLRARMSEDGGGGLKVEEQCER